MNKRLVVISSLVVLSVGSTSNARASSIGSAVAAISPVGITASGDAILVADFDGHRILRYQPNGQQVASWGGRGNGPGELSGPFALASDRGGHIYVADQLNHRIQKFANDGRFLAGWGERGKASGQFENPMGIAVDRDGAVYITDLDNHRVQKFSSDGALLSSWGGRGDGPGELADPWGIAIDASDHVLVADHGNHRIQKFTRDGAFVEAWGTPGAEPGLLLGPMAIAASTDGSVYVTDLVGRRVQQFSADGAYLSQWESEGENASYRWGLALDASGVLYAATGSANGFERIARDGFIDAAAAPPVSFTLARVWPNPSVGSTTLRFGIPSSGHLRVEIFSVDGRRVRRVVNGAVEAGLAVVEWDGRTEQGRPAAAGVYFVRGSLDAVGGRRELEGRIVRLR